MVARTTVCGLLLLTGACGRLGYDEAVDARGEKPALDGALDLDAASLDGAGPIMPRKDGGGEMTLGDGSAIDAAGTDGGADAGGGGGGPMCGDTVCSSGQRCCTGAGCSLCVDGRVCPMISCEF